jgi:light-regulated signal transduction histidine kinase (bacteriophytochrome)
VKAEPERMRAGGGPRARTTPYPHWPTRVVLGSRAGRVELQKIPVGLGQLVLEAQAELQPEQAGREVEWQVGSLPEVQADRTMLSLVVANLLSNALKFTRPRARALIEIRDVSTDADEVTVMVRDNGVGFDRVNAIRS